MFWAQNDIQVVFCEQALKVLSYVGVASYMTLKQKAHM